MIDWFILLFLILLSAIFSGLTIGYMGLDKTDLRRKARLNNKYAKKIIKIRQNTNLLLCSLLLGNVGVNIAIPLYLDKLLNPIVEKNILPVVSSFFQKDFVIFKLLPEEKLLSLVTVFTSTSFIAGLIATILILIFGEIIPQAATARNALKIGAYFSPLIKFVIFIFYPIAKPLSIILDFVLGHEKDTLYNRFELMEIIKDHEDSQDSSIDEDEERIIIGALEFSKKTAKDIMCSKKNMFFIKENNYLTTQLLKKIKDRGFTRIPVFHENKQDIVGILYAKDLIGVTANKNQQIKEYIRTNKFLKISQDTNLDTLLETMSNKAHMALLYNNKEKIVGLVTLEDIIEEILNREIIDESDEM